MSAVDSDACRSGDSRPRAPVTSDSGVSSPRPCGVDVAENGRRAEARTKPPLEVVAPILAVDSNVRRSGDSRPRAPVTSDSGVSRPRRIHSARPDQRERPQPRPLKHVASAETRPPGRGGFTPPGLTRGSGRSRDRSSTSRALKLSPRASARRSSCRMPRGSPRRSPSGRQAGRTRCGLPPARSPRAAACRSSRPARPSP